MATPYCEFCWHDPATGAFAESSGSRSVPLAATAARIISPLIAVAVALWSYPWHAADSSGAATVLLVCLAGIARVGARLRRLRRPGSKSSSRRSGAW